MGKATVSMLSHLEGRVESVIEHRNCLLGSKPRRMPSKTEYESALLNAHALHEGLYRRVPTN
jgi:hypothetical protein